jgi:diguanylate cyclase (GGDEF)-like protein
MWILRNADYSRPAASDRSTRNVFSRILIPNMALSALAVLHTLLGGLCLAVGRGERYSAALRVWGWGLLLTAAGMLAARTLAPPAGTVVGSSLIAAAPVCYVMAALTHTRVRFRRRWQGTAVLACVLPAMVASLAPIPWFTGGVLAPTPIAILLFVFAAVALARRPPSSAAVPGRLVGAALAVAAATWALRIGVAGDLADRLGSIGQMVTVVAGTFGLMWIEIKGFEKRIERFANADPLTGLPNARGARLQFKDELARAARHKRTLALVLLDIDRFKQLRDVRGELACDAVIQHVAATLRAAVRSEDGLSRLAGETFALLLPEQTREGAEVTAERLRAAVAATPCKYDAWPISITMSAGVAVCPTEGRDWPTLWTEADRRLQAARGGNR